MDLDFTPAAAASWHQLTDLEQIRVELVARRVAISHLRRGAEPFEVASYDLRIKGQVAADGASLLIEELSRVTSARSGPPSR